MGKIKSFLLAIVISIIVIIAVFLIPIITLIATFSGLIYFAYLVVEDERKLKSQKKDNVYPIHIDKTDNQ